MAGNKGTLLLLAGASALMLMSGKKKRRNSAKAGSAAEESEAKPKSEDLDDADEDIFETDDGEPEVEEKQEAEEPEDVSAAAVLSRNTAPDGRATLGMLYQIQMGDTPLEICREALFGSRAPVNNALMRQAAKDLLVRIDCGPWNQALYGVPLSELMEGHANLDSYFTQRGVSFNPIYKNNAKRILNGMRPTSGPGSSFALIWIPMINLDRFDLDGAVTTEGVNHPDTPDGMGGSAIDPPQEIIDLEFEAVSAEEVGCDLPEGDFRKAVIASA